MHAMLPISTSQNYTLIKQVFNTIEQVLVLEHIPEQLVLYKQGILRAPLVEYTVTGNSIELYDSVSSPTSINVVYTIPVSTITLTRRREDMWMQAGSSTLDLNFLPVQELVFEQGLLLTIGLDYTKSGKQLNLVEPLQNDTWISVVYWS